MPYPVLFIGEGGRLVVVPASWGLMGHCGSGYIFSMQISLFVAPCVGHMESGQEKLPLKELEGAGLSNPVSRVPLRAPWAGPVREVEASRRLRSSLRRILIITMEYLAFQDSLHA